MRASLTALLDAANATGCAVPAFNVFGHEDALGAVRAAEARGAPAILATNRETVEHYGLRGIVAMLATLAEEARVPVCVHLDHCHDVELAKRAVDAGYDSVMYDGSSLSLDENVAATAEVVAHAHAAGVDVEGEIGSVAYDARDNRGREHVRHELTEPDAARAFADSSGVDAVAVSIGNVHRLREPTARLDFDRLERIARAVDRPLVVHGASGIPHDRLARLAATQVAKLNVGTALRRAFAASLRASLAARPDEIDRLALFADTIPAVGEEAGRWLERLGTAAAGPSLMSVPSRPFRALDPFGPR